MAKKSDRSTLETKLAELEADAAAIRTVLAILDGQHAASSARRGPATMAAAIAGHQAARGNGNGTVQGYGPAAIHEAARRAGKTTKAGGKFGASARRQQRQRSADFLARFDPVEPRTVDGGRTAGLGSLVRRGYLKRKADGYIRTAKPYDPDAVKGTGH